MDIGGKNTQELDQIRIWTAQRPAGPGNSTVLGGILGRSGGLWLKEKEKILTAVTQEKYLLFFIYLFILLVGG